MVLDSPENRTVTSRRRWMKPILTDLHTQDTSDSLGLTAGKGHSVMWYVRLLTARGEKWWVDRWTEAARTFEETCMDTDYSHCRCLGLNCESATEVDTNRRCFVRDVCVYLEITKFILILTRCYPLPMHTCSQRYQGQSHHEPLGVCLRQLI